MIPAAPAMVAMINGDMIGTPAEPGEHVDWNTPDLLSEVDWRNILGEDVATYVANNPHMIAWEES